MSLGFSERGLDNACSAVMKAASNLHATSNEDCSDFTNPQIVKQFLMKFASDQYAQNYPVESGKIYGCVFKNVFVGFENTFIVNGAFTEDGSQATCVALFWQTLGF